MKFNITPSLKPEVEKIDARLSVDWKGDLVLTLDNWYVLVITPDGYLMRTGGIGTAAGLPLDEEGRIVELG